MKIRHIGLMFIFVVFLFSISSVNAASYKDVSAGEALDMMLENPELVVIDVSPIYDKGHLPGAVNHPVGDGSLDEGIPMLDKDKVYLVYCHADEPSIAGAQALVNAGFENVYRLEGNYHVWIDAGYPVAMLMDYIDVTPKEALKMMLENSELVVIDVSPIYDKGHLPGSVNHPVGDGSLDEGIHMLDRSKTYLVYCHMESASRAGAQKLVDAGFQKVYRMDGDYKSWIEAGYPVEK
ncbi:MAG: rhodanese-like domain-containing protein [Candidatus Cloacimonetes bacterium]|nr:rhodanese-like domain-containing protein [Candidatus Cloacimonadota bacterium]